MLKTFNWLVWGEGRKGLEILIYLVNWLLVFLTQWWNVRLPHRWVTWVWQGPVSRWRRRRRRLVRTRIYAQQNLTRISLFKYWKKYSNKIGNCHCQNHSDLRFGRYFLQTSPFCSPFNCRVQLHQMKMLLMKKASKLSALEAYLLLELEIVMQSSPQVLELLSTFGQYSFESKHV